MTYDDVSIPVTFQGERFIWIKFRDGTGPLAYLEHVDEDGGIKPEHALSESFAHVCQDGKIRRHFAIIGSVDDLQQASD